MITLIDKIKQVFRHKQSYKIQQAIDEDYVQVKIENIGLSTMGLEGYLVLKTDDGKQFPISAFSGEVARHIAIFREGKKDLIPTVYNLVEQISEESGLILVNVKIYSSGDSLRANLYFTGKKDTVMRNFRASDAIALATFYDIPILIRKDLIEQTTRELA